MSDVRHVVKVSIVGEEYSIRSDGTPEHTRAVATYLDQAIRKVVASTPLIEVQKAAILAALQITDELFRERVSARTAEESIRSLNAEVRRWLPPAKRGDAAEAGAG
jgi:cell division protein ZapA